MSQDTHTRLYQATRATVRATFSTAAALVVVAALHLPSLWTGPM